MDLQDFQNLSHEQIASQLIYIHCKKQETLSEAENRFLALTNTLPKVDLDKVNRLVEQRR